MGALITLPRAVIVATETPGVFVETENRHALVRRLELNLANPLYPYVVDRVSWPKQPPWSVALTAAYYVVEPFDGPMRYLGVSAVSAAWISEADALIALGAKTELVRLELEDAAVALAMGDLDAARVQWIRWRDAL